MKPILIFLTRSNPFLAEFKLLELITLRKNNSMACISNGCFGLCANVDDKNSNLYFLVVHLPRLSSETLLYFHSVITFCVSRRRRKMYCGHPRLCVCLSAVACPHYYTDPDVTWSSGRGIPLSGADLQSVHGLRCYDNKTRTLVTSLRPSRDMTT